MEKKKVAKGSSTISEKTKKNFQVKVLGDIKDVIKLGG